MEKELYKVIFAEDEEPLRKAICQVINWKKLGFKLVCEAGNGQEALEMIRQEMPDVLLTDIYMPLMDGLELAKNIRINNHSMKIVILTGYDKFEYAKQALELGVSYYILKPTTPAEFEEVLLKIKEELDQEITTKRNVEQYKKQYEESLVVLRERALLNLITNSHKNIYGFSDKLKRLGIQLKAKSFIVAVGVIENKEEIAKTYWENDLYLLDFAIYNVCKESLLTYDQELIVIGQEDDLVVIFKENKDCENRFEDYCIEIMSELRFNIQRIFNMELSVGIGDKYNEIEEITYSYKDALTALEYRPLMGLGKTIVRLDVERKGSFLAQKMEDLLDKLEYFIKTGNMNAVIQQIDYIFSFIRHANISLNDFKTALLKITVTIYSVYNEMMETDEDYNIHFHNFNEVFEKENIEEIKAYYVQLCESLIQKIGSLRENDQVNLVKRAITFIQKNYSNKALDIKYICEHLHISASYFSKLFKTQTKETIVEYITRIRMDKSKELLKTSSMKVFQISELVGYDDQHYFSYNFRKQTGMTPTEYRKSEAVKSD